MEDHAGETPVMTIEKFKFVFGLTENISSVILIRKSSYPVQWMSLKIIYKLGFA